MRKFIKYVFVTLLCEHDYRFINGYRHDGNLIKKIYKCSKCGKKSYK